MSGVGDELGWGIRWRVRGARDANAIGRQRDADFANRAFADPDDDAIGRGKVAAMSALRPPLLLRPAQRFLREAREISQKYPARFHPVSRFGSRRGFILFRPEFVPGKRKFRVGTVGALRRWHLEGLLFLRPAPRPQREAPREPRAQALRWLLHGPLSGRPPGAPKSLKARIKSPGRAALKRSGRALVSGAVASTNRAASMARPILSSGIERRAIRLSIER